MQKHVHVKLPSPVLNSNCYSKDKNTTPTRVHAALQPTNS